MATTTSLQFKITSAYDGGAVDRARASISALNRDLDTLSNKSVKVTVQVDSSALTRLRTELDQFSRIRATATANVDTQTASLDAARASLARFGAMHATATADVDTDRAHTHLTNLLHDSDNSTSHLGLLGRGAGDAGRLLGEMGGSAGGASSGVNGVGQSAGGASSSLSGMGTAIGVVLAALALVGPIAALASAAVIGTLGTAFVGMGALALSKTAEVKSAFTGLKTSVMADMTQAAQGMKGPLLAGIEQLKTGLHSLLPAFTQAFSASGKLIQPLVASLLGFTRNVMPGVITALKSAGPIFDGLKTGMASLGTGISKAFAGMAAGAKGAGAALNIFLSGTGKILATVGVAFGQMAAAGARSLAGLMTGLNSLVKGAMAGFVGAVKAMDGSLGPFLAQLGAFAGLVLQKMLPVLGQLIGALLQGLTPVLKALGPPLVAMGQAIGIALTQAVKLIIPFIVQFAQFVAKLMVALTPLIPALGTLLVAGLRVLIALITPFIPLLNVLAGVIGKLTPLIQLFANGINIVSLAITAAIKWITDWKNIVQAFSTAWNAIWNALKVATLAIWNALQVAWGAVVRSFQTAWSAVASALTAAWNAVWNGLKTAAQAVWNALQVAWSAFVNALRTAWTAVSGALVSAWNATWNALRTAAQAVWSALQTAWNAFVNALRTAWTALSSALTSAWNATWNALRTAAQAVWTAMQTAWTAFTNALRTAWTALSSALTTAWNATWNALKTAAIAVWNALQTAWTAFTTFLRNLWNSFASAMTSAWNTFWNAIKTAALAVWNALQTAWNAFTNVMKGLLTGFVNVFKTIWNDFWNGIKTIALDIWHALQTAWDNFSSGFQAAVRLCVAGVKHDWDALQEIFKAPIHFVIATVINGGIIKAINWVIGKLGGSSTAVPDVPVPFATGGHVRGPGTGTSDSIPARLSDGEYVLRADAVRRIGVDKLDQMNGTGQIAGMSPQVAALQAQGFPIGAMMAKNKGGFADGGLTAADIQSMFGDIIKSIGGAGAGLLAKATGAVGGVAGTVKKIVSHVPIVGGILAKGAGAVQSVADSITSALQSWGAKEFATASADLIQKILTKLPLPGGNGPLGEMAHGFTNKIVGAFGGHITKLIADFLFKQQQVSVTSQAVGAIPAGQHKAVIDAALAAAGVPPPGSLAQWEAGLNTLITRESAWNPNAINRTDSNAVAGIPSQGLAQVIPPTFAANHVPGTSMNILDPVANIAAAIRYIVRTYGNISNVQQANASLPPKGYWTGTSNARRGWHLVGERGAEWAHFNGGEKVLPHGQSPDDDGSPVVVHVENHWHGPVTKEAIQHAEGPMADKLRMAVQAGCGKRRH